ncbi:MAG TPA: hypothetical protein VJS65_13180 [Verrucomicrobiae bacterium]|nr:hypothetical protein [Verrucomicrobiae bacterium]
MRVAFFLLVSVLPLSGASVEILSTGPQATFGGGLRLIEIILRNSARTNVQLHLRHQVLQVSSTIVAPWSEVLPVREVTVVSNQTVIERVEVAFPTVRAVSRFVIRLLDGRESLGHIDVQVYPENLLSNTLASAGAITLLSVTGELKEVIESGLTGIDPDSVPSQPARPRLLIVGPAFPEGFNASRIAEVIERVKPATNVVLIFPGEAESSLIGPSFYPLRVNQGNLVCVRHDTLSNLKMDPRAQMRLARIIRLAAGLERLGPPESASKL